MVSVGSNLVSLSLATDTAGSGRVPPGFKGVVRYKPTRGTISLCGVTPLCLSLDCVAVITKPFSDAKALWDVLENHNAPDTYAKLSLSSSTYHPQKPYHYALVLHTVNPMRQSFIYRVLIAFWKEDRRPIAGPHCRNDISASTAIFPRDGHNLLTDSTSTNPSTTAVYPIDLSNASATILNNYRTINLTPRARAHEAAISSNANLHQQHFEA
ncbi:amidase signature enzyme [Pleomassaria siparia CBS 279.74]|uniref:Amidase signature enzyme n=1 Tax=Pleomassaria siparia CBS 279.74 TaxID=1314801 RepID=A0A6G1KH34_9PLEO|nr:amidase signature enzyme [Pleomassaria siparia CBS 279.74]